MKRNFRKILSFIKQDLILYPFFLITNYFNKLFSKKIEVKSIEETINIILEKHCSVSRYGDGEFLWMMGIKQQSFQENSKEMQNRLLEIIRSSSENHIICLSDSFGKMNQYNRTAKKFWLPFMVKYRAEWIALLDTKKTYYNTNMTRLYMDYKNKEICKRNFEQIKKLWSGRDIVIIEGEMTRLGVGNDLFQKASSIKRILAPSVNAFSKYNKIMHIACGLDKQSLILIALGPTATILAFDLSKMGYQAIDAGHIDIEYEWMLRKAKKKIAVQNKYVNEVDGADARKIDSISDTQYSSQIINSIL